MPICQINLLISFRNEDDDEIFCRPPHTLNDAYSEFMCIQTYYIFICPNIYFIHLYIYAYICQGRKEAKGLVP